jgi:hypothetical protein
VWVFWKRRVLVERLLKPDINRRHAVQLHQVSTTVGSQHTLMLKLYFS